MRRFLTFISTVLWLFASVPAQAGRIPEPGMFEGTLDPGDSHQFTMIFSRDPARVIVRGDRASDLDLYVYTLSERLVGYDDDYTDQCVVLWTPPRVATYIIEVVNNGGARARYRLQTN